MTVSLHRTKRTSDNTMNQAWINYEERLNRVTTYIYDHLDAELDLMRLADVAALSPYHWHRVYHAVRGETITATVKRLRLQRAALALSQGTQAIGVIATAAGYTSVQAFTRAFAEVYGMPPARYREEGGHAAFAPAVNGGSAAAHEVEIRMAAMRYAVGVPHVGSFLGIGKAFGILYGKLASENLIEGETRMIGIYESDPGFVAEADLRSAAAVFSAEPVTVAPPLQFYDVYPGPYAVLRHKGPYTDMRPAYRWLYGTWLPQSSREAANAPILEEYLNNPRDVAPAELLTDIHLPLRG
jgi:AraC family transcriptional regulator